MKVSNNPGPSCPPCKEEEASPRTLKGKLMKAFRNMKTKLTKKNKKTKIKSRGQLRGQWTQKELPKIVKKIVDSNPGLTSLEIYGTEIRWHCEINYFDLFPRKKKDNQNPSKREDDKKL